MALCELRISRGMRVGPANQDCSERTPTFPDRIASMPCTAAARPCTVVTQGTLRSTAAVRIS